jgi:hypothetical protein
MIVRRCGGGGGAISATPGGVAQARMALNGGGLLVASRGLSILLIGVTIEPMPNENTLMISDVIMEKPHCGILFRRSHVRKVL